MNIQNELQEMARKVATGSGSITIKDIATIIEIVDFPRFNPNLLPPESLADNSVKVSKHIGLKYVKELWGLDSETLVRIETDWLNKARAKHGASEKDEKDVPADLVTPQALTRIIALAYFVYRIQTDKIIMPIEDSVYIIKEAVEGLNLFLKSPALKGRLRTTVVLVNGKNVNAYNFMTHCGVHAGGFSKYLPMPEESFPYIFSLFDPEALKLAYSK